MLPIHELLAIGVTVRDLEATARNYAQIFGIDQWEVREFLGPQVTGVVDQRETNPNFRVATGVSPNGAVTFDLIEPRAGESEYLKFQATRRRGISHLRVARMSRSAFDDIARDLAETDIKIAQSISYTVGMTRHLLDTRSVLGGYFLEIEVVDDAAELLSPDHLWDFSDSYSRPAGVKPLEIKNVHHFGVVVADVMASTEAYASLYGADTWRFRSWRPGPGRLDAPFYRGHAVDHEYFCALHLNYRNFGFELIQPTHGPSHYNRDFFDKTGPGIHHLLLSVLPNDPELWERTSSWLADELGAPIVMGSPMFEGAASFWYLDTQEALGWVTETVMIHTDDVSRTQTDPDFCVDFSAPKVR